ncbi:hypothetical protein [Cupriavidus gilardii]|uniref:hypothetical protein n=1 Tax=Cupriavidus gilardii TaxID=82541 RepID=UPI0021BFD52D|nr:hypothetical protein [Cupriavidus gilardii]MCT9127513.1 hypothetical protein [Cupriavidus gilardii]
MLSTVLNAVGLVLITLGGIGAALCTPTPRYNSDGSVSLVGEPDKEKRIAAYRRQRLMKPLLAAVGFGALLQFVALFAG